MSFKKPVYTISKAATENKLPIVISIPHAGTMIPEELARRLKTKFVNNPPDTDWHVDKLYSFANAMGITTIQANYSRYVIDLNRDPENKQLYSKDRFQTDLVPVQSFQKEDLYIDTLPDNTDITLRLENYYWPYYGAIKNLLADLKQQFSNILLFDAHSIKRLVPAINASKFPSLILGDNNQTTAAPQLIDCAFTSLQANKQYDVSHNQPFKGGNITKTFADPKNGIHCLQLEMAQDIYMDELSNEYLVSRARGVQEVLKNMFDKLSITIQQL